MAVVLSVKYDFLEIGGVEVLENTKDHVLMRLTHLSPTQKVPDYHVRVNIDQKTKQMAEVEVTPTGVFFADIAEEVKDIALLLLPLLYSFSPSPSYESFSVPYSPF